MFDNITTLFRLAADEFQRVDVLQKFLWSTYPDIMFNNTATGFLLGVGVTLYATRSKRGKAICAAIADPSRPIGTAIIAVRNRISQTLSK